MFIRNTAAAVAALALASSVMAQTPLPKVSPKIKLPPIDRRFPDLDPKLIAPLARPDMKAESIQFSLVSKKTQFEGTVRITGVVRNIGKGAFKSGVGQQTVYLYEGSKLVAKKSCNVLNTGQTMSVSLTRGWYSGTEFTHA